MSRLTRTSRITAALSLVFLLTAPTGANAETLSAREAVAAAYANNPTYAAQAAQLAQTVAQVTSASAQFDPSLILDAGATRSRNPSLAATGGVTTSTADQLSANAMLKKKLVWGTELSASIGTSYQRTRSPFTFGAQANGASTSLLQLGPGYSFYGKLAVTQPLLRGAGSEIGLAPWREAMASQKVSEVAQDKAASELARDVLNAYWELWYAGSASGIQRSARQTSQQQRDEAAARRDTGSLAPADVLAFETQLATAEESLVQAENDEKARGYELARLLGRQGTEDPLVASGEPPDPSELSGDLQAQALEASDEVRQRRADLELAEIRARTADDNYRSRLDLDAYVQAQGLGNGEPWPGIEQMGGLGAVSAHVGLTYELPLDDRKRKAEAEKARLAVISAQRTLEATQQRVLTDVASGRDKLTTARKRVQLATSTRDAAKAQADAEQARYRTGSSTPLQVVQAQDQLRSAELRLARARVDLAEAHVLLLHLTGRLTRQSELSSAP